MMEVRPEIPYEMSKFSILQVLRSSPGPRLGRLAILHRDSIDTPHYLGLTSRGVVPHLSQDSFAKKTSISGVYVPLEDFTEKSPQATPPVYKINAPDFSSPLRKFIALPENKILVVGARRVPPVVPPTTNSDRSISISTSLGFRPLESGEFVKAVQIVKPDIVVSLADIPNICPPSSKRIEKMTDRTLAWANQLILGDSRTQTPQEAVHQVFAPILPISNKLQSHYIDCLVETMLPYISGIALYDSANMIGLPESFHELPRLSLSGPKNPSQILREIQLGIDLFTIPFVGAATDAGIALNFTFPVSEADHGKKVKALGVDMWVSEHATDLSPLQPDCQCYACLNHHRAYIQHLLSAKEMLAWVLLQIHNHRVIDEFFHGIRSSIAKGSFEDDCRAFDLTFETDLPEQTGQGPRVRGYQFKTEANSQKRNSPGFTIFDTEPNNNHDPESAVAPVESSPPL